MKITITFKNFLLQRKICLVVVLQDVKVASQIRYPNTDSCWYYFYGTLWMCFDWL